VNARAAGYAGALLGIAVLSGCATTPPEQDPVQIKLNDLDTRLVRIERVVANRSLLDLANEVEAARADLRSVHNSVDQLNHELDQSRKQQRDLYVDLDSRLKKLEARAASAPAAGGADAAAPSSPSSPGAADAGAAAGAAAGGTEAGGDAAAAGTQVPPAGGNAQSAYEAAFALLKDGEYDKAIAGFQQFLAAYPDSEYADNAQYWLGEAYYVNRRFTDALSAFQAVVARYGQSRKLPDALLKVGYCDYELKQWDQAKAVLTEVVDKFPDTPAGRLAAQRLDKMKTETH